MATAGLDTARAKSIRLRAGKRYEAKSKGKKEAEALTKGTGTLVNQDQTEAISKETGKRVDNLRVQFFKFFSQAL